MQSSFFGSQNFFASTPAHQKSSDTLVRSADLSDVNEIGDVLTLSFNNFNDLTLWIYPFIKLSVCEDLRNRLKKTDASHFCLVAVNKITPEKQNCKKIKGTVELSFRTEYGWKGKKTYPYIANLAVSKNYRRQGIGSKLLSKCETIAKEHGFKELYLHVLASNQSGKQLYLRNGYTIRQVETDLYSLFVPSKRRLLLAKSI
ncbi:GCN5-related N-acetyltransferase [Geminocystis sp. NIES-3708]|uniref:GNAT family N-acetyltransferase n=1 Tax=Geminocystis sp. NIES-3708 TaxID=1615909 RepID=UPI0005FC7ED5|nr:GNAT family N-acetyltransferase [Geminocystis sp. NIES-3708]BAQ62728.1 GCN5-related N-acetyltransferase [Geminocystis sp. NIES-3708]